MFQYYFVFLHREYYVREVYNKEKEIIKESKNHKNTYYYG